MADAGDSFLSRWSRRKIEARNAETEEAADAARPAGMAPGEPAPTGAPLGAPFGTFSVAESAATHAGPESEPAVQPATPAAPAQRTTTAAAPPEPASGTRTAAPGTPPPPTLADVSALTRDSDYARFVAPDVTPAVKNAALKKLFSDPHFNVMDGLDTYIDDYGKPDPLPPGMLRKMVQSRLLGLFAGEPAPQPAGTSLRALEDPRPDESVHATIDSPLDRPRDAALDAPAAAGCGATASAADDPPLPHAEADPLAPRPSAAPAPEEAPAHEDADLQLQPDDASRRPGDRACARADPGREQ